MSACLSIMPNALIAPTVLSMVTPIKMVGVQSDESGNWG